MTTGCDLPIVHELVPAPGAEEVFEKLASLPHCLFLDSACAERLDFRGGTLEALGRHSFVTADPFDWSLYEASSADPLAEIAARLTRFSAKHRREIPPFQGGAAGYWSYDLARAWERLPPPRFDEFALPRAAVGWYDVVVALDHVQRRAWMVSQGFPEVDPAPRAERARARLEQFLEILEQPPAPPWRGDTAPPLNIDALAPQYPMAKVPGLWSDFTADTYRSAVARAIEYVFAGDLFQVNLAQRLLYPAPSDSLALYRRLRRENPAPFAAYLHGGAWQVLSASPERFLRVRDRMVETRPIKGTRRRAVGPEADLFVGDELQASAKDRAENVMIVDLLRNDLSRVCDESTICVQELCRLERYEFVAHLVSVVEGRLRSDANCVDLLRAAFPGGSITGAPKIRAMEIIAELEPTARGPYCGALGYLGFNGQMDTNLLIRTLIAARGWVQAPVGGGIVAQSDPASEYEETWSKAAGLLRALCI